jgi:AcrR family transcriptional regulator
MISEKPSKRRGRPPASEPPKSEAILRAALVVFSTHGFDGASLRQIAAEADVDVALISHKFGSKLGVWRAVVDDLAASRLAAMRTVASAADHDLSHGERLRRVMSQMIDAACDSPHVAQFAMKEAVQRGERFDYVYERLAQPLQAYFLPLVRAARASGELGDVSPELMFFAFAGAISMAVAGRPYLVRLAPGVGSDEAFRRELKRALLGPLPTPRPSWPGESPGHPRTPA